MGMGTIVVDQDVFDEDIYVESTPAGHAVFSSDREGEMLSAAYDEDKTARAWMAGWRAAMELIEHMS